MKITAHWKYIKRSMNLKYNSALIEIAMSAFIQNSNIRVQFCWFVHHSMHDRIVLKGGGATLEEIPFTLECKSKRKKNSTQMHWLDTQAGSICPMHQTNIQSIFVSMLLIRVCLFYPNS